MRMGERGLSSLACPSRTGRRAGLACLTLTFALAAPLHALDPQKSVSQFTHTAWSGKDGIPGPVRAMAQTQDGYLWLGTEAGLYRFDGLRFTPYEPSRAHPHGAAVLSLLAARDGSLWMGFGSGGVALLRDGQVTHFPPGKGVPAGGIFSIVEDTAGSIWAAGEYGFASFQNGQWRRVGTEMGYAAPAAQSLLVDRKGTLWVATDGLDFGLSRDPVRVNTILSLAKNATRFSPTGDAVGMIHSMAEAPDGAVWVADTSGQKVRPIDPRDEASRGVALDQEPLGLTFGSDGSLWIGLLDGGLRRTRGLVRDAPLDRFGVKDEFSGSIVYAALKDREGNLWFGTAGSLSREQGDCLLRARRPDPGSADRADLNPGWERVAHQLYAGHGPAFSRRKVRRLNASALQLVRFEPDPIPARKSSRPGLARG